jgi:alkyldihydroxyacetonephosphate synthase
MATAIQYEMIRSELEEIVGEGYVSTRESDRLVYATDWFWVPQMWLDRGEEPVKPDYIVHPNSAEEVAAIMQVANNFRIPVVPWGGGSGSQGGAAPVFGGRSR